MQPTETTGTPRCLCHEQTTAGKAWCPIHDAVQFMKQPAQHISALTAPPERELLRRAVEDFRYDELVGWSQHAHVYCPSCMAGGFPSDVKTLLDITHVPGCWWYEAYVLLTNHGIQVNL